KIAAFETDPRFVNGFARKIAALGTDTSFSGLRGRYFGENAGFVPLKQKIAASETDSGFVNGFARKIAALETDTSFSGLRRRYFCRFGPFLRRSVSGDVILEKMRGL
ncbi:hypothetical protein, partial [Metabacillus mangrovi]|uniref:hypothetical protein n=1 Tax=Metabacillus mangrovi TaxID=1491830 RepID=UPI0019D662DB